MWGHQWVDGDGFRRVPFPSSTITHGKHIGKLRISQELARISTFPQVIWIINFGCWLH